MYKFIYWVFVIGVLWAPLFTIFYWQFGNHRELDAAVKNIKVTSFFGISFKLFLIGVFGIYERWVTSISFLVLFFIFQVTGVFK